MLNSYKTLKKCGNSDIWEDCDSKISEECTEICSLVEVACVADKDQMLSNSEFSCSSGSGSGKHHVFFSDSEQMYQKILSVINWWFQRVTHFNQGITKTPILMGLSQVLFWVPDAVFLIHSRVWSDTLAYTPGLSGLAHRAPGPALGPPWLTTPICVNLMEKNIFMQDWFI